MDNLNLIAKSEKEFQKEVQTVKTFSDDIDMEFGFEKCAKIAYNPYPANVGNMVSS